MINPMRKLLAILCSFLVLQAAALASSDFVEGYKALEKEDYKTAISLFQKSIADPDFILPDYGRFFLAKSYYQDFAFASAEALAQEVIANKNEILIPDAYILIGKCRLDSHNNKSAADAFSYLIKKYPGSRLESLAYYLLAEAKKRQGKFKEAYRLYSHIDIYTPLSPYAKNSRINMRKLEKSRGFKEPKATDKTLFEEGEKYWKAYRYKEAAAIFTKLMKQHPHSKYAKSALYLSGLAEYETNDYEAAINTLEKNIKQRGPANQNSYYYLGRSYGRKGLYPKAIGTLQYFISLYPDNPLADNAYYYIGYYNEIEKDFDAAISAYDSLIKKYPKSALVDTSLWRTGRIYYLAGNKEYALRTFAQAFNYTPNTETAKCLYWWGKLTEEKSKSEAASIYAYIINNFDHNYYSYRSNERLNALRYQSPLDYGVIKRTPIERGEELSDRAKLLVEAGLTDYAEYEAGVKASPSYQTKLGLLLHRYGEYRAPIGFAEKKIKGAALKGEAGTIPKTTWELAYPRGFWTYVKREAGAYKVDPYLVLALIREESRFNPKAVSRSYARGLMQIINSTGKKISKDLDMSYYYKNLYKPETNIKMGTYYFASLLSRFGGNPSLALAGYNGGPNRVKKWVNEWYNGDINKVDVDDFVINIPIKETRDYVEKVMGSYYQYKRIYD